MQQRESEWTRFVCNHLINGLLSQERSSRRVSGINTSEPLAVWSSLPSQHHFTVTTFTKYLHVNIPLLAKHLHVIQRITDIFTALSKKLNLIFISSWSSAIHKWLEVNFAWAISFNTYIVTSEFDDGREMSLLTLSLGTMLSMLIKLTGSICCHLCPSITRHRCQVSHDFRFKENWSEGQFRGATKTFPC